MGHLTKFRMHWRSKGVCSFITIVYFFIFFIFNSLTMILFLRFPRKLHCKRTLRPITTQNLEAQAWQDKGSKLLVQMRQLPCTMRSSLCLMHLKNTLCSQRISNVKILLLPNLGISFKSHPFVQNSQSF